MYQNVERHNDMTQMPSSAVDFASTLKVLDEIFCCKKFTKWTLKRFEIDLKQDNRWLSDVKD